MRYAQFLFGLVLGLSISAVIGAYALGALDTDSSQEVRLSARPLADGRTEVALQQRVGERWSERHLPQLRFVPADAEAGRWLNSTPIEVSGAETAADLSDLDMQELILSQLERAGEICRAARRFAQSESPKLRRATDPTESQAIVGRVLVELKRCDDAYQLTHILIGEGYDSGAIDAATYQSWLAVFAAWGEEYADWLALGAPADAE